jgi:hypothetical protein
MEVRTASPLAPHRLSEPVERYDIPDLKRGTIFLDVERQTWFMYYNDFDRFWDVKLAPVGAPDLTPPSQPVRFAAKSPRPGQINLSWLPAEDMDTGVVVYRIYRDGQLVAETKAAVFTDAPSLAGSSIHYAVSAVNLHGTEGPAADLKVPAASGRANAPFSGGKR